MGFLDYVVKSLGLVEEEMPPSARIKKNVRQAAVKPKRQGYDWPVLEVCDYAAQGGQHAHRDDQIPDALFKKSERKNIAIFKPKNFNEIKKVVDFLKTKQPSVVSFNELNESEGEGCVQFFLGALLALDGRLERVQESTYLIVPKDVNILTRGQNN